MITSFLLTIAVFVQDNPASRTVPIPTPIVGPTTGQGSNPSLPSGPTTSGGGQIPMTKGDEPGTPRGGPRRVVAPSPPQATDAPNPAVAQVRASDSQGGSMTAHQHAPTDRPN